MAESEESTVARCLARVGRWRLPTNYSHRDWMEEVGGIATLAALIARAEYDSSRGVPWNAFLYERILSAALARYRQEWRFASQVQAQLDTCWANTQSLSDRMRDIVMDTVVCLPDADRYLIHSLFWAEQTQAELAAHFAVTQQAMSKRKRTILNHVRERSLKAFTSLIEIH